MPEPHSFTSFSRRNRAIRYKQQSQSNDADKSPLAAACWAAPSLPRTMCTRGRCRSMCRRQHTKHYWQRWHPTSASGQAQFRFDDPRRRYVVARGTLRSLLGQYLNAKPTEIKFTYRWKSETTVGRKARCIGVAFQCVPLRRLGVIAFALGCEVGIDVEQLRDVGHLEQIATAILPSIRIERRVGHTRSPHETWRSCAVGLEKKRFSKHWEPALWEIWPPFKYPSDDDWQGWVEYSAELAA